MTKVNVNKNNASTHVLDLQQEKKPHVIRNV